MGLIQTYDQLTFSYEAIIEGMRRMKNDVSVSPKYVNNILFSIELFKVCFMRINIFPHVDFQRIG